MIVEGVRTGHARDYSETVRLPTGNRSGKGPGIGAHDDTRGPALVGSFELKDREKGVGHQREQPPMDADMTVFYLV